MTQGPVAGHVSELRRYPVKSMLGESLDSVDVTKQGFPADRGLAFIDDETGKVVSAKMPAKWRAMLQCSAHAKGYGATITLPDGQTVSTDDEAVNELVSELLGRRVTLRDNRRSGDTVERAIPEEVIDGGVDAEVDYTLLELAEAATGGSFVDYAPLHMITSSTLGAVSVAAGHNITAVRYRPNIVFDLQGTGFVENDWVGSKVRIGNELVLRAVIPTPRCAVPTLAHGELDGDPDAVRTLLEKNRIHVQGFGVLPAAGVYAEVLVPGRIAIGDAVVVG
jgi:uncharacterized protein